MSVVYWCLRWMRLAGFDWLVGFWVVSLWLCLICLLIFGFIVLRVDLGFVWGWYFGLRVYLTCIWRVGGLVFWKFLVVSFGFDWLLF